VTVDSNILHKKTDYSWYEGFKEWLASYLVSWMSQIRCLFEMGASRKGIGIQKSMLNIVAFGRE